MTGRVKGDNYRGVLLRCYVKGQMRMRYFGMTAYDVKKDGACEKYKVVTLSNQL